MAASSASLPDDREADFRILLVGRTGHGKSATANTILGDNSAFKVSSKAMSETRTCQWSGIRERFGHNIEVVDSPGFFDTNLDERAIRIELIKAVGLTAPGFHVIAYVLKRERFTEEMLKTQQMFFEWFGSGVEKFACIILTHTHDDDTKDEYIREGAHEKLTELVQVCGNRVVALDNMAGTEMKVTQVKKLFKIAEMIKEQNKTIHFTNVSYQITDMYMNMSENKIQQAYNYLQQMPTVALKGFLVEKNVWVPLEDISSEGHSKEHPSKKKGLRGRRGDLPNDSMSLSKGSDELGKDSIISYNILKNKINKNSSDEMSGFKIFFYHVYNKAVSIFRKIAK